MPTPPNTGSELESYVHFVYSRLLNLRGEGQRVFKDHTIVGRSTATHQIDVYYEFERAGVVHRVAIECKDRGRPITKGMVQEFYAKIDDIGNLIGVVVSRRGYQQGAEVFARHYGIRTLTEVDLPQLRHILAGWIESAFLPSESYVGEPFWAIMETAQGKVTGVYCCAGLDADGAKLIPIFISRRHAQAFLEHAFEPATSAVRGLPQHVLRSLVRLVQHSRDRFVCYFMTPEDNEGQWVGIRTSAERLQQDFVLPQRHEEP